MKKEYLALIGISTIFILVASLYLFAASAIKDVDESYTAISNQSKVMIDKIKTGELTLTNEEAIKLFENKIKKNNSIQPLLKSYVDMINQFAYLIIGLSLLQSTIIIYGFYKIRK